MPFFNLTSLCCCARNISGAISIIHHFRTVQKCPSSKGRRHTRLMQWLAGSVYLSSSSLSLASLLSCSGCKLESSASKPLRTSYTPQPIITRSISNWAWQTSSRAPSCRSVTVHGKIAHQAHLHLSNTTLPGTSGKLCRAEDVRVWLGRRIIWSNHFHASSSHQQEKLSMSQYLPSDAGHFIAAPFRRDFLTKC